MSDALVSYAALILADAESEITSDKLVTLVKAAGGSLDQIWADIYAQALEGKNLKELLFSAAAAPAAAAAAPAAGASEEAGAAEEAKEEEEEESDDDMGFGLFD